MKSRFSSHWSLLFFVLLLGFLIPSFFVGALAQRVATPTTKPAPTVVTPITRPPPTARPAKPAPTACPTPAPTAGPTSTLDKEMRDFQYERNKLFNVNKNPESTFSRDSRKGSFTYGSYKIQVVGDYFATDSTKEAFIKAFLKLYQPRGLNCTTSSEKAQKVYSRVVTRKNNIVLDCILQGYAKPNILLVLTKGVTYPLKYTYPAFVNVFGNLLGPIPEFIKANVNFLGLSFILTVPGRVAYFCGGDPPKPTSPCYQGRVKSYGGVEGSGIGCYCSNEGCATGNCYLTASGLGDTEVPRGGYLPGAYVGQEGTFTCQCK